MCGDLKAGICLFLLRSLGMGLVSPYISPVCVFAWCVCVCVCVNSQHISLSHFFTCAVDVFKLYIWG